MVDLGTTRVTILPPLIFLFFEHFKLDKSPLYRKVGLEGLNSNMSKQVYTDGNPHYKSRMTVDIVC